MHKTTLNIPDALYTEISRYHRSSGNGTITKTLNDLLLNAIESSDKIKILENERDLVLLKTLHLLRRTAGADDEEFLSEVDRDFVEELPTMREMIKRGFDYGE